jgi:hypothetical protein
MYSYDMETPAFQRNDWVTVIRDFPRLGILADQKMAAHVEGPRGGDVYEISWYDEASHKRASLMVMGEWIEHRKD